MRQGNRTSGWLCTLALFAGGVLPAAGAAAGAGLATVSEQAAPTVAQILDGYAAARGGAAAWGKVLSMGWTGRIESTGDKQPVSFLMLFQRPASTRFEVLTQNQRSVRIFDGKRGWKMRPGGEIGIEVQDYTPEEVAAALDACGLDGPLANPDKKGVRVTLDSAEMLEQRRAWKLVVTLPSGAVQVHWIDAENFHDLRYDRPARDRFGRSTMISVYLRNYQTVEGLTLPLEIETRGAGAQGANRMLIEKVAINPTVAANAFQRPDLPSVRHRGVIINTAEPPGRPGATH